MIRRIYLLTTNACNMACKYCYQLLPVNDTRREPVRYMTVATAEKILQSILDRELPVEKRFQIYFFGGEPTLNRPVLLYFWRAAQRLRNAGFQPVFTIQSNLWTSALLELVADGVFFSSVTVSIDGPKDVHDRNRVTVGGSGTYNSIMSHLLNLLDLKRAGKVGLVSVEATLTTPTQSFAGVSQFLMGMGIDHQILVPEANAIAEYDEQFRTRWLELVEFILDSLKSHNPVFEASTLARIVATVKPGMQTNCGAGSRSISIAPDGVIYPCGSLTNVAPYRQGTVAEIQTALEGPVAKALNVRKSEVDSVCRDCSYNTPCRQQCFASNFYRSRDHYRFNNPFCRIEQTTLDLIARKIGEMDGREIDRFAMNIKLAMSHAPLSLAHHSDGAFPLSGQAVPPVA